MLTPPPPFPRRSSAVNHILTANHGKRIAIIENEFGEVGVDDSLIRQRFKTDEDIFEMRALPSLNLIRTQPDPNVDALSLQEQRVHLLHSAWRPHPHLGQAIPF